jgi:protein-disulfide isomerase
MKNNALVSSLLVVVIVMLGGYMGFTTYNSPKEPTKDEFGQQVRGYLLENPKVLREAIELLSVQEARESEDLRVKTMASRKQDLEQDGFSFVAGNPDGDVTVVEFFDYRCGYCKRSFPDLMKTVEADGNVRLVLKEFPVLGPESIIASRAAFAADKQGKYMELHVAMMQSRGSLSQAKVLSLADKAGLDLEKLVADMNSDEISGYIRKNYELAQALNITGTPAFVVGDQLAPGAIPSARMAQMIANARTQKTSSATN